MARENDRQMIDDALDWFEENPTGGGAPPQPFREIVPGIWSQDIQYGTGNALTVDMGDELLQVDTGIAADHARGMIENVRKVSDKPVGTIISSKSGKELTKREVVLCDDSGFDIRCTFWGDVDPGVPSR